MSLGKNGEGTLGWLRYRNRQRVIDALRTRGQISQAEIARATGLSRTTVSTLVGQLRESGLVTDLDSRAVTTRGGRPAVRLALKDPTEFVGGIDFGHSHVQVAVADLAHNVLAERRCDLDVDHRANESLNNAARMFNEVLDQLSIARKQVLCVGIGIPGPVDRTRGTVGSATILPGWVGLEIAAELRRRLTMPMELENDANLGALAELTWGGGRDCSNFVYIKASTGIGAGIVIDGRLLRGATGTAGEIGHTTLDESGPLCHCGNRGCLETVASGPAIIQLVGSINGENLTLTRIVELAAEGDPRCRRAIADAGREIGVAAAGLCNLINPQRVILGGVLCRAGEILLQPLRESIARHAVQAAQIVEVRQSAFLERAELLGALALALQKSGERMTAG